MNTMKSNTYQQTRRIRNGHNFYEVMLNKPSIFENERPFRVRLHLNQVTISETREQQIAIIQQALKFPFDF